MNVYDLNLPIHIVYLLRKNNITSVDTLIEYSVNDLLAIPGMGVSYCDKVCECLVLHGYILRRLPRDRTL